MPVQEKYLFRTENQKINRILLSTITIGKLLLFAACGGNTGNKVGNETNTAKKMTYIFVFRGKS